MNVYIEDLMKIIQAIGAKKKAKGYENRDEDLKLQKIKDKVARAGRVGRTDMEELLKNALKNKLEDAGDEDSFGRPDSGDGDEDEEDSAGEDDLLQELEEEDFDRKSRMSKKRRKSTKTAKSRGSGGSHRTTKTAKTTKTNKTMKSARSNKTHRSNKSKFGRKMSMRSSRSKRSFRSGKSSVVDEEDDDAYLKNPHAKVIGTQFLKGFKRNKTYIEKLTANDFKNIEFDHGGFPRFAVDFFKYITLLDLEEFYIEKRRMIANAAIAA